MTLEEARQHVGDRVAYRRPPGEVFRGEIAAVNGRYVFVLYDDSVYRQATDPADLTLLESAP